MNRAEFVNRMTDLFMEGFPSVPSDPDRRAEWNEVQSKVRERAQSMADIIDSYIRSATVKVTIPPGTVAVGAGTAAMPNPVPIALTGTPTMGTGGLT